MDNLDIELGQLGHRTWTTWTSNSDNLDIELGQLGHRTRTTWTSNSDNLDIELMWYNSRELAGIDGLPSTKRNVQRIADRENWKSRKRQGRGGGKEYHIDSLPPETQAYLLKNLNDETRRTDRSHERENFDVPSDLPRLPERHGRDLSEIREGSATRDRSEATPRRGDDSTFLYATIGEQGTKRTGNNFGSIALAIENPNGLDFVPEDPKVNRGLHARSYLLTELDRLCGHLPITAARQQFASLYNSGELEIPQWVREKIPKLSAPTLARWQSKAKKNLSDLQPRHGHRKGKGILNTDAELQEFVLARIAQRPIHIYEAMQKAFPEKCPSDNTVRRFVLEWRKTHADIYAKLTNEYEYNSKHRPAAGSYYEGITHALQRIEIDATKGDVLLRVKGKIKRYTIVAVIDVCTRRVILKVIENCNAKFAAQTMVRSVLTDWGKVQAIAIRTDKGKEFVSYYFKQCLQILGINHEICTGYSGWEKPFVERLFGTNTRDMLERTIGYCGHDVKERQAIRSQFDENDIELLLTPEELQEELDRWVGKYERRAHSGEGLRGLTPLEKWEENPPESYRGTERSLDLLLSDGGVRTIQKKGIRIDKAWYINSQGLQARYPAGEKKIFFKFDPTKPYLIHVFDWHEETQEIGKHLFCAEDFEGVGNNRAASAKAAHEVKKERLAPVKHLRKLQKEVQQQEENVVSLAGYRAKKQRQQHNLTDLEREAEAVLAEMEAPKLPEPEPLTPQQEERRKELVTQLEKKRNRKPEETNEEKFFRLYTAFYKGESLPDPDSSWLKNILEKGFFPGTKKRVEQMVEINSMR